MDVAVQTARVASMVMVWCSNTVMVEFGEWLRAYNAALPNPKQRIAFYGLDL